MALDTESHLETLSFEPVHSFYRTVTFLTGDLLSDVALVIEEGMLRNVIDLDPGSGYVVIEIPVLHLHLGVFGDDVFMAIETLFHRGKSWMSRVAHVGVAELALDLFDAGMDPMAEGDGLLGTDVRCRWNVEIVKKG
jgi:hypothetical protein